jgi:NAD(P)-dependent dehydrogenase (short-subunit alcohol dehydrogenase family)
MQPEKTDSRGPGRTGMVVGATGGIGLALTEALLEDRSFERVIAVHRPQSEVPTLEALSHQYQDRLERHALEFRNERSMDGFKRYLQERRGGIDLTVHAAGLLHGGAIQPEKTFMQCRPDHLLTQFEVNAVFPMMVASAVLQSQHRKNRFVFAALSAMVGSIEDNRLGGWYGYRASKSALNQFIKTLAIECRTKFPHAAVVAMHPGTTDTELSRPFQRNVRPDKLYTPRQTAARLLRVIDGLDSQASGRFINWDGSNIHW